MANIPQETPLPSCTSVDDVQEDNADSTKTSENAGNDATDDDSLCHDLTSFHNELLTLVSHHQCRSNQLRQTERDC